MSTERKIALLGTAPSSLNLAPLGGDWEVWSCSPGTYHMPNIDKFFEIHRFEPGQPWFSEGYCDFLRKFDGEVIMSKHVAEVKGCTLLPAEELVKKYGPYFFTSTIAWMMAMAIDAGATKIGLWGIDMAATTEYKDQRMGCQYFATLARAMGIEVGVPPESDLLRPAALYGVCENTHGWIKQMARARELSGRLAEVQKTLADAQAQENFLNGALDDQDWQIHSWFGNDDVDSHVYVEPPLVPALEGVGHHRPKMFEETGAP